MTTATPSDPRRTGARVLFGSAGSALILGLVIVVVAALADGREAALGALMGSMLVVVVLTTGAMVVDVVAGLMPAMSLLVALMTYTLQIALLALLLLAVTRSDAVADALDADWLAAGVIGAALCWTVAQVRLATRARIPLYDLADQQPVGSER